uniref:Uncharacterized protein n=1 Tax=Opuntia streptacantha TaxID=393608 RepID=A0A7C9ERC3_OPUST
MCLLVMLIPMSMRRFSSCNAFKQMLLTPQESLICEFPTVWIHFSEPIGVELANKAREVVMLEVLRQKVPSKLRRVPNYEAIIRRTPRNHRISSRIVHHIVRLAKEWRRPIHIRQRRRIRVSAGVRSSASNVSFSIHSGDGARRRLHDFARKQSI